MTLDFIQRTDPRDMTNRQLIEARSVIGRAKLAIRRQFDWRTILYLMERAGTERKWDKETREPKDVPAWRYPVCGQHKRVVSDTAWLNGLLGPINAVFEDRRIGA